MLSFEEWIGVNQVEGTGGDYLLYRAYIEQQRQVQGAAPMRVAPTLSPKKTPMKIGAEIEFWGSNGIDHEIVEDFGVVREYYNNMFELNNFIEDFDSEKDIYNFLTNVVDTTIQIQDESDSYYDYCFETKGIKVDDRSMIFNGLHIHLSLGSRQKTSGFVDSLQYSRSVEAFKLKEFPSLRSIYSHHIWGAERGYGYDYKSKDKFRPVIWVDRLGTAELRIFDNEDILVVTRRKKVAKFLWETISTFLETSKTGNRKRVFCFNDGDNVDDLAYFCKSTFLNGKNKFRYNNIKKILTTPAGQELRLMDDYIDIIKGRI